MPSSPRDCYLSTAKQWPIRKNRMNEITLLGEAMKLNIQGFVDFTA